MQVTWLIFQMMERNLVEVLPFMLYMIPTAWSVDRKLALVKLRYYLNESVYEI